MLMRRRRSMDQRCGASSAPQCVRSRYIYPKSSETLGLIKCGMEIVFNPFLCQAGRFRVEATFLHVCTCTYLTPLQSTNGLWGARHLQQLRLASPCSASLRSIVTLHRWQDAESPTSWLPVLRTCICDIVPYVRSRPSRGGSRRDGPAQRSKPENATLSRKP